MIRRILDPNPITRITVAEIKQDHWFRQAYVPSNPEDEEDNVYIDDEAFSINDEVMMGIPLVFAFLYLQI